MSGYYDEYGNYVQYGNYAEENPLQASYDSDPLGTTLAIVAAGNQEAAMNAAGAVIADNSAVVNSQVALTTEAAVRNMKDRYGANWDAHSGEVREVLARNPQMLGDAPTLLDPETLTQSLDNAYKIARADKAESDKANRWSEIMNAAPTTWAEAVYGRGPGTET